VQESRAGLTIKEFLTKTNFGHICTEKAKDKHRRIEKLQNIAKVASLTKLMRIAAYQNLFIDEACVQSI